ncbi:MAG TPA: hypothetical protein DIW47_14440, partial [Bacteroidetes bacterium]|nr:hypothetical protein [Bacteroidota bacterium]
DGVASKNDIKYLNTFSRNLYDGISYYVALFSSEDANLEMKTSGAIEALQQNKRELDRLQETIGQMQFEPLIHA